MGGLIATGKRILGRVVDEKRGGYVVFVWLIGLMGAGLPQVD